MKTPGGMVIVAMLFARGTTRLVPKTADEDLTSLGIAVDFVSTFMADARLVTVLGSAKWLGTLLGRTSASPVLLIGAAPRGELPVGEGSWRRPPQQADDDDDDDDDSVINDEDDEAVVVNNELQYGWMAAYALLILEEPSEFLAAVRQLPPRPQLAGVLAVCFRRPLPVADEGRALRSVLRTAVRAGRWNTVVFVSQGATEGSLHGVHPLRRGCFNSTPVTLASWTLGGGFHPRRLQFDNPKQYTLNGCKLRTAFFLAPPTMQLIHKAGDPTTRPGGFTGRVLDAMSVAMNATFKLQMWSTDKKKFGKYRGVTLPRELGDTVTGRTELTVGPITALVERWKVLDWASVPLSECYVWLVPSSVGNVERSGLWNVVASFSAGLWLLLVAMVALAVLALVLMGGERAALLPVGRVVVVVVVALIGQPTSVRLSGARARPSSNVAKILHGAWLLTALVTCTAYQAKLWSIVSRTNRVGLFSLDDLIDTGLPVSMPSVILYNMMDTQNASLRVLVDRGLLSASMRKPGDVGALKWGSRIVLLDDAMADYWGAYKIQADRQPVMYRLPRTGCFTTYPSNYFAVARGSPLLPRMEVLWVRLWQAGVLGRMFTEMMAQMGPRRAARSRKAERLQIHNLRGPFQILFIGCALSTLIFIGEHLIVNCVFLRKCASAHRGCGCRCWPSGRSGCCVLHGRAKGAEMHPSRATRPPVGLPTSRHAGVRKGATRFEREWLKTNKNKTSK